MKTIDMKPLDRMTAIAQNNSDRIDVLLAGYTEIAGLVVKTTGDDLSKHEVSAIIAETMKKFTSH